MRLVAMGGGQTLSFPLRQGSTLIGRHTSCHICIPTKTISRRHCQCYVDGMKVTVRDIGSSHGTYVNGKRLEGSANAELHPGDVLSLGIFDLRFEATEGGATYGRGAAAEEIVVTAAPAGAGAMPGAGPGAPPGAAPGGMGPGAQDPTQPLGQGPPPPAPTDFPEQPAGDETPADQTYMPAPYVPRQETVMGGGAAGQPQLVVREGRWFLRDPLTGREVEIAPAGAPGAAAARPAEARRPNTRLLVTVIAIAAIVVIAFAAVILRPKPNTNVGPRVSDAEYAQDMDGGIDELKKKDYEKGIARFKLASGKRRDLETARLLSDYARLWQAAGGDFLKLNKTEATRYLDSINQSTPSRFDKALAFAREQLDWIRKESDAVSNLEAAMSELAKAGNSEEGMLEVRNKLHLIPRDSCAAKPAAEAIADINRRIAAERLGRAERAKAQSEWAKAITDYQDALPFIEDAARKAEVAKLTDDCRRYAHEGQLFRQAQDAVNNKNYGAAREPLKSIKPGHYYQGAQRLLSDIDRAEKAEAREAIRQQIEALYRSGAGPQAAELAKKHGFPEFDHILDRVKRIEDLLAAGRKAEDEKRFADAEAAYGEAGSVESDANNDYRRRAERMAKAIKDSYPRIAADFAQGGLAKFHKQDFLGVRADFDSAIKYDPANETAKKGYDLLKKHADLYYFEGQQHVAGGRPVRAKEVLERARDCAEPGSKVYHSIVRELEKLKLRE